MLNRPLDPSSMSLRELSQRVPGWVRGAVTGLTMIPVAWWGWTWSGPYRWLAELQSRIMDGSYSVTLALVCSWLLVLVPTSMLVYPAALSRYGSLTAEQIRDRQVREARLNATMLRWDVRGLMFGVGFLAFGALAALRVATLGALQDVTVAQLASGANESDWVRVPLEDADYAAGLVEEGGLAHWTVPLIDPAAPNAPVAAFITFTTSHVGADRPDTDAGVISLRPLSQQAAVVLEEYSVPVAEHTVLVDLDDSPDESRDLMKIFGGLGTVLTLICGGLVRRRGL